MGYKEVNVKVLPDFLPRYGSIGDGMMCVAKALFMMLFLPLSVFAVMNGVGQIMITNGSTQFPPEMIQQVLDGAWSYVRRYIKYSIPLFVIAFPMGFYPLGNYARIPFQMAYAIYSVALMILFTQGGIMYFPVTTFPDVGSAVVESVTITLNIRPFIFIFAMISIVKAFLAFLDFSDNRRKYLEKVGKEQYKKDQKKARRIEKRARKAGKGV